MKRRENVAGLPLSPEFVDRQAAIADARLVLGVINMLEHLDDKEAAEPLDVQLSRLQSWLMPDTDGRGVLGGFLG